MSSNPGRECFKSTDQELENPQFFSHIYLTQLISNSALKMEKVKNKQNHITKSPLSHEYTVKCCVEISHMLMFLIWAHIAYYFCVNYTVF